MKTTILNVGDQYHTKTKGSMFFESGGAKHTKVNTNMFVSTDQHLHLNGSMDSIIAYDIPLTAQPDIQNLENTQIDEDTIIPKIPHMNLSYEEQEAKCQFIR